MSNNPQQSRRQRRAQDRSQNRREQRIEAARRAKRKRMLYTIGGAAGVALLLVVVLIVANMGGEEVEPVTAAPARNEAIQQSGNVLGDPNAPVTIVEWADFQCPACGAFATQIEPTLVAEYIATGQVKLEYRSFPFLDDRASGNESDNAAEASLCAMEQDKFWAYHDMLYYNQDGENQGAFSKGRLVEMARSAGLDVDQFESCIDGDEYEDEVEAMYEEARAQGVNSTPTFFINGTKVTGASYQPIKDAIEQALASQ